MPYEEALRWREKESETSSAVDWQSRALAAEAELAKLKHVGAKMVADVRLIARDADKRIAVLKARVREQESKLIALEKSATELNATCKRYDEACSKLEPLADLARKIGEAHREFKIARRSARDARPPLYLQVQAKERYELIEGKRWSLLNQAAAMVGKDGE